MPYRIQKALAVTRWDLIVNGQVIATTGTKWEMNEIVLGLCVKQLLTEEIV